MLVIVHKTRIQYFSYLFWVQKNGDILNVRWNTGAIEEGAWWSGGWKLSHRAWNGGSAKEMHGR